MLPVKHNNNWYLLGLIHGLLLLIIFLVPTGVAGAITIAPTSIAAFTLLFLLPALLISLAGRSGKTKLWLSLVAGNSLAVLIWMFWLVGTPDPDGFLLLGIFLSGLFFLVPGLTLLGLVVGLVLEKVQARKTE